MYNKGLKIIGISLMLLFLMLIVLKYYIDKNKLEKEYRVTISTVCGYKTLKGGGRTLYYYYIVNGQKYTRSHTIYYSPKNLINKRFFVMFYPPNPKNSKLLLLHGTVPEQIQQAPPEGWEGIPKVVKKKIDE